MRRADRLFRITQRLRSDRAVTARALAQELEVSERTIYRDIQDLALSGVPVYGEPGSGYRITEGYRLPPLMFEPDELAALLLGVRMVGAWADVGLAAAAERVLGKVEAVLPLRLAPELARSEVLVPPKQLEPVLREKLALLRRAIADRRRVRFGYRREDGTPSERVIRPLGLFHWGKVWTLAGWCELRGDFRHFRVDRVEEAEALSGRFEHEPGRTLDDYLRSQGVGH